MKIIFSISVPFYVLLNTLISVDIGFFYSCVSIS